jgi:small subunit ribosomal protein S3
VGHKTHPIGFRLGIVKDWKSHWFAANGRDYRALALEDLSIRETIDDMYSGIGDSGISSVEIDRETHNVVVNINSARPGILIGRDGERVKRLRARLEGSTGKRIQLNILEVSQPELDARLVARNIAEQLERRVSYRRAIRQAAQRAMQAGAQGIKIILGGRIMGAEIARKEKLMEGRVPLHTLRANVDFAIGEARTLMGRIGVKVWIYQGDILPEPVPTEDEEEILAPIEVTVPGQKEEGSNDAATQTGEVSETTQGS